MTYSTPDTDAAQRAELLKQWALELGFHRAGVARVAPPETAGRYLEWLERGDHAAMEYMAARARERVDPRQVLPAARSVICVALQYATGDDGEDDGVVAGDLWPGVARYARGRDYHNVMLKRLRKLARRVRESFPGTETKITVDTGPLLERALAAAAGIGVPGKNTMLLHAEAGSYFFLGELLLSLELAPDPAVADLCGSCTLCLEACPTGALPEPYRLDSRRCISYWTIEHRGGLPPSMRSAMGEWVFGCDVCQDVCPLNGGPLNSGGGGAVVRDEAFAATRVDLCPDLESLATIKEQQYQESFRGSPMKRARREGLRRNAIVAMGNRHETRYVPTLAMVFSDPDPVLRSHAAWALGQISGRAAHEALSVASRTERDPGVCEEIEEALSVIGRGGENAAPVLS